MILWLYGLAFSLSFWFLVLDYHLITELLPLIIASALSLLYTLKLLREKKRVSLHLGTLSTSILCIVLFATKPETMYIIFSIVFAVIVLLMVAANIDTLFVAPPTWLAGANALSLILTAVIYILFYATLKNDIEPFYVLIPMAIMSIVELYIILNIKNMPSLCSEMKSRLRTERITYFLAILIAAITTILYATESISAEVNLFICVCAYAIGLIYSTSRMLMDMCRNQSTKTPNMYTIVLNPV